MESREELVSLAALSAQCFRHEELLAYMKKALKMNQILNKDEQRLLQVAFKNSIEPKRAAVLKLTDIETNLNRNAGVVMMEKWKIKATVEYKYAVFKELFLACSQFVKIIGDYDHGLISINRNPESRAFFYKLSADYCRYIAEVISGEQCREYAEMSLENYKMAANEASTLGPCHPVRLSVALNLSVYYYEILNSIPNALRIAEEAFDGAVSNLSSLDVDSYQESVEVMDLLHNNIRLWEKANGDSLRHRAGSADPSKTVSHAEIMDRRHVSNSFDVPEG